MQTLKGVVTGKSAAAPVKDAAATIVETAQTTKPDSAGEYSFKPLHSGKYARRVVKEGFQDFEDDELDVKLVAVNHLDVELEN